VCSRGGVDIPGGDGMNFSTQVPVCQARVGDYGQVLSSIKWLSNLRTPTLRLFARCLGYLRRGYRGHGRIPSQDTRISQTGVTGGEILPAHGYWDEKNDWCGVLSGLVLFRLIVHPLQIGVVGPYPV
jgi:hypothetical protein